MNIKHTLLAAALVATVGFAGAASAATTATFKVKINIQASCDVTAGTASDIDFGNVAANAGAQSGTSNISVTCSNGTPYILGLATGAGNNGTGTMAPQDAGNSGDSGVPYSLWQDSAHTKVWGNTGTAVGAAGNDYVSTGSTAGDGTGSAQTIPVYATVASTNHMPGNYSDTVTVKVIY
jgi:spore coat protein U-like protein